MTPASTPIADITVPAGRRRLDPAWVVTLADLFATQGQLSPIELVKQDGSLRLIFGRHRLAAANMLGWTEIGAVVHEASAFANEAEITLREISENLARRELSVLDRAVDIARWRDIYEAAHGTVKRGRKNYQQVADNSDEKSERFSQSFSQAVQTTLRLSWDTVNRAVKIASIAAELRDRIALHPVADNQSELLALAAEPAERQVQIVALLTSEPAQAATVASAIEIIDRLPPAAKPRPWERLSEGFSRLSEREQDSFFALHAAAIERWLKARSA